MLHNNLSTTRYEYNNIVVGYCGQCGFIHQHPLPDADKLKSYYTQDEFYKSHAPNWLEKEKWEHKHGLWNPFYDYKLDLLGRTEPDSRINSTYLYDVGCGAGWFLQRAKEKKWFATGGCEPSVSARKVLNLHYVTPERTTFKWERIHHSLVLEHVIDPYEELVYWHDHLVDNGKILVVVPNDFNPLQNEIGYLGFISPVHINYFTPSTLESLLEKSGFIVEKMTATFPMELFVKAGLDYRGNSALGRKCHLARLALEKVFGRAMFSVYEKLYNKYGWGRELVVLARKR